MGTRKLAEPLSFRIRFRSLRNEKILSLTWQDGYYEFVELDSNADKPFVMRFLYTGFDMNVVQSLILQEVCDVR